MVKIKTGLLLLLLLCTSSCFAQQDFSQFYLIRNLISNELIKGVSKDKDGFIWIATDDGVVRYDGYQSRVFYKEIPTQYTKGFLLTQNERLFLVHDAGLKEIIHKNDSIHFNPLSLGSKVYDESLDYPKGAYEDKESNIWVGEMNSVIRYSREDKMRWDLGEELRSIDYHRSFAFAEDAFGNMWIAPFKGPLLFYDKSTDSLKRIQYAKTLTQVKGITCVKGDYLLVGGKEGIMQIKIDSDHTILDQSLDESIQDISIIKSINNSDVYAGTAAAGLYYFNFDDKSNTLKRFNNIPFNDILDLFFDDEKAELWVAGSENIGLFKPSIVETLNNVGENRIEAMATDSKNGVYYSNGKQVFYLSALSAKPKLVLSAEYTYFNRLYSEGEKLWIGDAFGKVYYYDLGTKKEHVFSESRDVSIRHLFRDAQNNKWFAGHSEKLIRVCL